ncbi:MAG TPA: rhomboid family intramembrane serine protease [Candidatus Dormibacteraeota bacterium]|nr:rhomboid family intramembrane serine protease [Candidatus Dormibacteraeota bacterium]
MDQPQVVRYAAQRRAVEEWSLALAAVGLESRIDWSPQHGYLLLVAPDAAPRAHATLDAYDDENRPRPVPPPVPEYGSGFAAMLLAGVLCLLFVVTGPRADDHPWFAAGSADGVRMLLHGEWWRAVTALTLHADFPHILSNAIALLIFGSSLCTLVGPGAGLWLLLLSGAAGNTINVLVRGTPYNGIGASTAIFGGLGALAAIRVVQRHRGAVVSPWRAWAPFAAGLALLGMLGSSARSDVLAHLFGFSVGVGLGAALEAWHPRPFAPRLQVVLVAAAALAVLACWITALHAGA